MTFWKRSIWTAVLAVVALTGRAPAAVAADEVAKPPTVEDEMLMWISDAESKLNQLAEAMPEDKYGWRPGEGVRSVAEVYLHVAGANYGIPSFWGVTPPEGFKFDGYEQSMTKKADIQKALKESFVHMKKSLASATDEQLLKNVEFFGMKTTVRGAYLLILSHSHEHLGQSIAYARSNKVVPPWTAKAAEKKEGASGF
jgi:uncharacterized damage-inducible protein DinB